MLIKQVSVFVENTTGRLHKLTKILADANIDIIASTIAETTDFGILRCILPDPQAGADLLKSKGFNASLTDVIAVSIEDKVGGFDAVLAELKAENKAAYNKLAEQFNVQLAAIQRRENAKRANEVRLANHKTTNVKRRRI